MRWKETVVGNKDNAVIIAYNVKMDNGFEVEVLNLGGVITKIITPNKDGIRENIVLAYDNVEDYITNPYYYGALIGRTAGKICDGKVVIDYEEYNLNKNYNQHQGHGGRHAFNHKIWGAKVIEEEDNITIRLTSLSFDGEENYPGNLHITVDYKIYENFKMVIEYRGNTDKETLLNMTNHTYFNLSGNLKRPVTEHYLKIDSDYILELDKTRVPTGKYINVINTPFDFRKRKTIGQDIDKENEQIKIGNGYDHTFLLNNDKKIIIEDNKSGRRMSIKTDQKSVVICTMNRYHDIDSYIKKPAPRRFGICFETQAPPIGRNMCFIEDSILYTNETYTQKTEYSFI